MTVGLGYVMMCLPCIERTGEEDFSSTESRFFRENDVPYARGQRAGSPTWSHPGKAFP